MIPGATELAVEAISPVAECFYKNMTIQATQVFGTLVLVASDDFATILDLQENPLVVRTVTGKWRRRFVHLTSYQGLAFCTRSIHELEVPEHALLVQAAKVFIPV